MATIGHLAVGLAAARLHHGREPRVPGFVPLAILYCGLALLPDADVLGFGWGIPYSHALGHRGAAHSTVLALGLGLVVALLFARAKRPAWPVLLIAATLASHGLLDALTDGGEGIALLWPLSEERFFAPWRPIPVAPIGLRFVSLVGLKIALTEASLFFPVLLWALWPQRRGRRPAPGSTWTSARPCSSSTCASRTPARTSFCTSSVPAASASCAGPACGWRRRGAQSQGCSDPGRSRPALSRPKEPSPHSQGDVTR